MLNPPNWDTRYVNSPTDSVSTKEVTAQPPSGMQSEAYDTMQRESKTRRSDRLNNEGLDPLYHDFSKNILDPRSEIPAAWFNLPLSQELMSQLKDKPPTRPESKSYDANGNFDYSIDLRRGNQELKASVSEGKQYDTTSLQLAFFNLQFASPRDFDKQVVEIADQLHLQKDLESVRNLAEKIEDPTTRRGLMLAVLEKGLRRNGDSYLNIAYEDVQKIDTSPETLESMTKRNNEILKRLRNQNQSAADDAPAPVRRPGLSEQEQKQLTELCSSLWSRDELLWNIARAKEDWSRKS